MQYTALSRDAMSCNVDSARRGRADPPSRVGGASGRRGDGVCPSRRRRLRVLFFSLFVALARVAFAR